MLNKKTILIGGACVVAVGGLVVLSTIKAHNKKKDNNEETETEDVIFEDNTISELKKQLEDISNDIDELRKIVNDKKEGEKCVA